MRKLHRSALGLALCALLALAAPAARAQALSTDQEVGYGVGAVICSMLYGPLKIGYAAPGSREGA